MNEQYTSPAGPMNEHETSHPQHGAYFGANGTYPKTLVIKAQNHHLALATKYINQYEERINDDRSRFSDIIDRQVYEDRAYKQAMMHIGLAQAEAATRQAEALESILEFAADLVGKTDIVEALLQWSEQQRAG